MAGDVSEQGWQPIETAPLRVSIILWATDALGGWHMFGELADDEPHMLICDSPDAETYFPHESGAWFTHWMPLPSPPSELAKRNLGIRESEK